MTTRVLTGITPSGTPHLGNYVGKTSLMRLDCVHVAFDDDGSFGVGNRPLGYI